MTTDITLIEKREDLKRRLAAGEYKTLVDALFDKMSRVIQRIVHTSHPISPWINSFILFLSILILALAALYLMGDAPEFFKQMTTFPRGTLLLMSALSCLTSLIMVVGNLFIHHILTIFYHALDLFESTSTLDDFNNWLTNVCNRKLHLAVSLIGGTLSGGYVLYIYDITFGYLLPVSLSVGFLAVYTVVFIFLFLLLFIAILCAQIGQYKLNLYTADPSSSEIILQLANLFGKLVYLGAIYAAFFVFVVAFIGLLLQYIILLIILLWIPLVVVFVLYQVSLSSIIHRAKWKTLNEIQSQVEELKTTNNLKDKETMETINRLMDFHDRVKATRNSAIDSSTILNFINSLLLPLLAFLLGNLDKVLLLFSRKP